jgi:hypothetical protein
MRAEHAPVLHFVALRDGFRRRAEHCDLQHAICNIRKQRIGQPHRAVRDVGILGVQPKESVTFQMHVHV